MMRIWRSDFWSNQEFVNRCPADFGKRLSELDRLLYAMQLGPNETFFEMWQAVGLHDRNLIALLWWPNGIIEHHIPVHMLWDLREDDFRIIRNWYGSGLMKEAAG